jgi:hypothetical protein
MVEKLKNIPDIFSDLKYESTGTFRKTDQNQNLINKEINLNNFDNSDWKWLRRTILNVSKELRFNNENNPKTESLDDRPHVDWSEFSTRDCAFAAILFACGIKFKKHGFETIVGGKGSLTSDMKDELEKIGQKSVPVEGRNGIAFGFEGMGEATSETDKGPYKWDDPDAEKECKKQNIDKSKHWNEFGFKAYFDAMYKLRGEKTKYYGINIFEKSLVYNKPWVLDGISKGEWEILGEGNKRRKMSMQMAPYWAKLKDTMVKFKGFKTKNPYTRL